MSLRNKLTGAVLSFGLIAATGIAAYAQQPAASDKAAPKAQGESFRGKERRGGRHHRGMHVLRIMQDLNLTEAQQTQTRAIVERFTNSIEPQRQALMEIKKQRDEQGTISEDARRKATELRQQIEESRKQMRTELLAVLTTEQRTQYEKLEQEWKARREEHRSRRGNRGTPPPTEDQL
ncbi:MAG: Spy/CpxP family protein refolding chaperone [Pyrinomonadaceae bacterium]|nr:Spy/CpxP family protein refolding chaperone [Pyrinomonadaceae bacterium]